MAAIARRERGMALLAVLFALTLLMMLALPFAVSMNVGADAAMRDVETTAVQQASASVREMLLADAALSHPSLDPTPGYDGLEEFPSRVDVPAAFAPLTDQGRVLLGGEVIDQQRFLALDGASPLLFANVLGLSARLAEDLAPGAEVLQLDDASQLPESGVVWSQGELIRYGGKRDNALVQLERGLLAGQGYADGKQPIGSTSLVLDYRCVLAAAWPFQSAGPQRRTRQPYRAVGELLAIQQAGFGGFSARELDALQRVFTVDTMATTAATWGRPERVFSDLMAGQSNMLVVKSALHIGPGSTVRLRNLRNGDVEYALVVATATQNGVPMLSLPSVFNLQLLENVGLAFPASDTTVEPLIPAPVNVNTAPAEVLVAVCAEVRQSSDVRALDPQGRRRATPPVFSTSRAREFAEQLVALRTPGDGPQHGPFTGWQDFVQRAILPALEGASGDAERNLWLYQYRNLQTGRDSVLEMGTSPICFHSGPWVRYRAAASRSRSTVATGVVARHERTGIAAAVPGFLVEQRWATQERFEDAFQLDRRAPFWVTTPVNLGALVRGDLGNDPAPRWFPHLAAVAYPALGLGAPRFPITDDADSGITPATAMVPPGAWPRVQYLHPYESFAQTTDYRGHDVTKAGPFAMQNTGPTTVGSGNGQPGNAPAGASTPTQGQGQQGRISFPFSNGDSFMGRFAVSSWFEPQALGVSTLFDHSDGNQNRNRLSLQVRDGNLVFEVLDEAGLDPNPSGSPAGVQRTASQWSMPVGDLALPGNTPLHVAMSAYSGRPADLSVAIDGVARGKPNHVTYLTGPLSLFDPTLANNTTAPNASGNDRYLDINVESTEGFPPVGVLRIGLELFEYSQVNGNSFRCRYNDSLGGRGARMSGREMRPNLPVDQNGNPRVNISDPSLQGVNLDFFPAHPRGALVELYGYSALLSESSPMMLGSTSLDGAVGQFAVARGFLSSNARPITLTLPNGQGLPVGTGLDQTWTGNLELADPVPTGRTQPPQAAQQAISDAFSTSGGYALLMQRSLNIQGQVQVGGATSPSTFTGGIEIIKYGSRQGNRLNGVQRAQTIPGQNTQLNNSLFDGTARNFVTDWVDWPWDPTNSQILWDHIPGNILWVVPISLAVQSTSSLWNPQTTGLSEWVQLYTQGSPNETEWVRYDTILEGRYLTRGNRAAWGSLFFELTRTRTTESVTIGPLGPNTTPAGTATPPWGTITATAGYIGYIPQLESTFPQIHWSRRALRVRGDMMLDFYIDGGNSNARMFATSSHPQSNAVVTQCHRLQLQYGNLGAYNGRVGRHDRVALVAGSRASGSQRPAVEWHSVSWAARRFEADNLPQQGQPAERLGPWPFQLVAFTEGVGQPMIGPQPGTQAFEPRRYDRLVKFPSGELPSAYCQTPMVGGGYGNQNSMAGYVDEVEVTQHFTTDLLLDQQMAASAQNFTVNRYHVDSPSGGYGVTNDLSAAFPLVGGLVMIDSEILAFQGHADGVFTVASNGRGLLNTTARDHDRGARVRFLTHRPAAILARALSARDADIMLQSLGSLPPRYGTLLVGRELLHYAWARLAGQQVQLEMPRHYPSGEDRTSSQSRGLFRGRFGTAAATAGSGEAVIGFPFRYWDRYAERSDDPELGYFQLTTNEAPVVFRSLRWREETTDPRVDVVCLVRADGKSTWDAEPQAGSGLWLLRGGSADSNHRIDHQASRLEVRFLTTYKAGACDLANYRAHGWKTTARVENVRVDYEGQGRVLDEQETAR